jgi:hypothetical protein
MWGNSIWAAEAVSPILPEPEPAQVPPSDHRHYRLPGGDPGSFVPMRRTGRSCGARGDAASHRPGSLVRLCPLPSRTSNLVGFRPIAAQMSMTAKKQGSLTCARSIALRVEYGTPDIPATSICVIPASVRASRSTLPSFSASARYLLNWRGFRDTLQSYAKETAPKNQQ